MADPAAPAFAAAKFHALLIGVNDYDHAPLFGCVNDVDAVQRVLLGPRLGLANGQVRIRRLTSPCSGARHEAVTEQPATLANLRDALAELGSDKISASDRVFIFYSGHGAQLEVAAADGRRAHREALVPVDYAARPPSPQVLHDFEINAALRAIVARTRSVAVMLDCCFATGVTRDGIAPPDWLPRFIDLSRRHDATREPAAPQPAPAPGIRGGADDRGFGGVDACHVVSACLNHEVAREHTSDGVRNGLLTRAFIEALEAATEVELASVTWAQIWQAMQAYVAQHNASQHLWMAGNAGREVFAGPPVERDPGLPVIRTDDGYRIEAGTLADITDGALVAVYGDRPAYFPPLGSEEDRGARAGVLRVAAAKLATATATADAPFELPPGARGRLVEAGVAARLRCAVVPPDPELRARLAASLLLEVVDDAAVKLEQHDGRWFVTDAIHGKQAPAPILLALPPDQLEGARAVLEHYHAYARPLRMAERIQDLNGGLGLRVLRCPAAGLRAADAALPEHLSEVRPSDGKCALSSGDTVCFEARNWTSHELRVTLVNCAASGKVQVLGDQVIVPGRSYVFWAENALGAPFEMSPPPGVVHCIDRMIAIGRTALGHALDYLQIDQPFAHVLERYRSGAKDVTSRVRSPAPPLEHWAAAQVVIETRAYTG